MEPEDLLYIVHIVRCFMCLICMGPPAYISHLVLDPKVIVCHGFAVCRLDAAQERVK